MKPTGIRKAEPAAPPSDALEATIRQYEQHPPRQ
jgi:hypothetical protein